MLKVYLTVDVEIWCDGWDNIGNKFNGAFQSYIYGSTRKGAYGLPFKLKVLNDYGLTGVFFVEPLFSMRFGADPLDEITGLIREAHQPVELHLHTEWIDEVENRPFPDIREKRQFIKNFSQDQQKTLIGIGKDLLMSSGVPQINAFRAGSFGFNVDTLSAVRDNDIFIDTSYNAVCMGLDSGLLPDKILSDPLLYDGVYEVPMTVFFDWPGHLKHTQLCACSSREMEGILWQALEAERKSVVFLSHNFELLDESRTRPQSITVKRYEKLCEFLDKNRDCFSVEDFSNFSCDVSDQHPTPLKSPQWKTGLRIFEQVWNRYS